jgi:iron(III) transport system ATP-binding protein
VAAFLGRGDLLTGRVAGGVLKTPLGDVEASELDEGMVGEVLVRPEDVLLDDAGHPGTVVRRHFLGNDYVYCVQLQTGGLLHLFQPGDVEIARGSEVTVKLASRELPVFAKQS